MANASFVNLGQPAGAIFDDVPKPYHLRDAAILRAAYGPAAVPTGDPFDEDYTWTEQAPPAGLPEAKPTDVDLRLAALDAGLRALQADVRHLQTIVHRLLNPGCDS